MITASFMGQWIESCPISKVLPSFGSRIPLITAAGLPRKNYGAHSIRQTKAVGIDRKTANLRAVQNWLGHSSIENIVRNLGVDIDEALILAERIKI